MSELAEQLKVRLTPRQQVFDELLTRYTDASSTVNRGHANGDPGEGVPVMPSVWTPSYRMLERLLRLYRVYATKRQELGLGGLTRNDYWHLAQWYLLCRRYPQWPKKRTVQRGRELVEVQPPPVWIYERHPDIEKRIVHAGLLWLDTEWDRSVSGRRIDFGEPWFMVVMGEPERPAEFRAETSERVAA